MTKKKMTQEEALKELEKLQEEGNKHVTIRQFLDFLNENDIGLVRYDNSVEGFSLIIGAIEKEIYDFFDTTPEKIEKARSTIIEGLQKTS